MMSIYDSVVRYLSEEKKGIVATVVNKAGAAPREEGAKMFVGEDKKTYGTIGGGKLEAEVIDEALKAMESTEVRLYHIRMDAKAVEDEGMLCGGNVDVLLEPILDKHKIVYECIRGFEKKGIRAVIVTRFNKSTLQKSLIDRNGDIWGDPLEKEEASKLRDFWSEHQVRFVNTDTVVEPLAVFSNLYIFGAGHVSQFLSKVAKLVDFNVTVIDDREEFANRERFPEADTIIVEDFEKVFNILDFTTNSSIVIVTRGHSHDALVLEKSVEQPTRYIGMIGSKRKVHMVLDYLSEKGVKKEILESIHAPIGIDINSETPQEIAISIVAELIKVRGMDH
jgi:xanthine dehydrogenase accessory factor